MRGRERDQEVKTPHVLHDRRQIGALAEEAIDLKDIFHSPSHLRLIISIDNRTHSALLFPVSS